MTYDSNSTVLMVYLCIIVQGVVQLTTTLLQMVLFADDIVVCMGRKEDMERNLAVMKVVMEKWEMRIPWGETKVLMVSRSGDGCKISVEGEEVEEVDKLKYMYLGVMISGDGGCDDEIEQRVGGNNAEGSIAEKRIAEEYYNEVFNAMVPTLLFGCEAWTMQRRHESKLQAFEMMCLRRAERVTRMDRVRNREMREALG